MNTVIQVIIDLLPILIVIGTAIYIFHEALRFIEARDKRQMAAQTLPDTPMPTRGSSEFVSKLRLQAAERFSLYLERINPGRLVMRLHRNGMSATMLQNEMLRTIREEFDHNLSQQIYISEGSWELIKNAQIEMIKFINATGHGMERDASGLDFGDKLLKAAGRIERLPSDIALTYLRNESRKVM